MSGTHKLVVPGRRMWALRLPADDLAKFFAAARACGVSKTQFIRYLILTYYDEHVLPAIVDESRKRGITVNDLLGEILTEYRQSRALKGKAKKKPAAPAERPVHHFKKLGVARD